MCAASPKTEHSRDLYVCVYNIIYIYIYIYILCTHTYMVTDGTICAYIYIYIYTHHMCVYIYIYTHVRTGLMPHSKPIDFGTRQIALESHHKPYDYPHQATIGPFGGIRSGVWNHDFVKHNHEINLRRKHSGQYCKHRIV